jgi:hypothetical protein
MYQERKKTKKPENQSEQKIKIQTQKIREREERFRYEKITRPTFLYVVFERVLKKMKSKDGFTLNEKKNHKTRTWVYLSFVLLSSPPKFP